MQSAAHGGAGEGTGDDIVVTEVRVHGVGGASPAEILNRTDIVPDPGADRIAGFYGATREQGRRKVRAYSWGGLTSRKASRALWTLLLPFSFINISGWMLEPPISDKDEEAKTALENAKREAKTRGDSAKGLSILDRIEIGVSKSIRAAARPFKASSHGLLTAQRWLVHVVAMTVTATYVMWVALLTVNLVGFQCGAQPDCYEGRPWLEFLSAFDDEVGRRLVVTAVAPIGLLVLFLALSHRSRARYDLWRADENRGDGRVFGSEPPALTEPGFWHQSDFITNMARVHFGAGMATFAGCLAYAMWRFSETFAIRTTEIAGQWLMVAAGHVVVIALIAVALMLRKPDEADSVPPSIAMATRLTFWGSIGVMAATLAFAGSLRISDRLIALSPTASDLWGFGWLTFGLVAFGMVLLMVLTGIQLMRWALDRQVDLGQFIVPLAFLAVAWWPNVWVVGSVAGFVVLINFASGMRRHGTGRERDTGGWMSIAVFYVVAAAGVVVGASWFVAAALMALVVATYQWAAASRNQDSFRWFGTAAVGAVGLLGLTGVLAGISLRLVDLLDVADLELRLPAVTEWMSLAAFFATAAAWTAGALYVAATWARWRRHLSARERSAPRDGQYVGDYEIRSAVRWQVLARATRSIDVLITVYAMLLFSATVAGIGYLWWREGIPVRLWLDRGVGDGMQGWLVLASWAELAYVGVAYWMVRSALRDEGWRRRLGMIWDVASFWPNRYHPFAPPAYAARAVPELIERIQSPASLENEGSPAATILSGHSQGSVLCFAAVAALPVEDAKRVVLVTHGSPLGEFYRTFFPGVFTKETFDDVGKKLLGSQHSDDGTWVNFYRVTDPIGGQLGAVTRDGTGFVSAHFEQWADTIPDAKLMDPCPAALDSTRRPVVRGHLDYDADPCMEKTLDTLTAILEAEARRDAMAPSGEGDDTRDTVGPRAKGKLLDA